MTNNRWPAACWALLASLVLILGWCRVGKALHSWNDGILMGSPWRILLGEVPNVDFVSGYVGGHDLVMAGGFAAGGVSVNTFHHVMLILQLSLVSVTFLVCSRFVSASLAAAGALLGFSCAAGKFWNYDPGTFVEIFAILTLGELVYWVGSGRRWRLASSGLLIGLGLNFKQSAVFVLAGVCAAISLRHLLSTGAPRGRSERILIVAPNLVVFAAYLLLRVSGRSYATSNYLVILPWATMIGLLMREALAARPEREGDSSVAAGRRLREFTADLAMLGSAAVAGTMPIALWYVTRGADLVHVLRETFLRVPDLIDRHRVSVDSPTTADAFFFLATAVVLLASRALCRIPGDAARRLLLPAQALGAGLLAALALLSWRQPEKLIGSRPGEWLVRACSPWAYHWEWWAVVCVPIALGVAFRRLETASRGDPARSLRLACTAVFASTVPAIMFPYPSSQYVISILIACALIFGALLTAPPGAPDSGTTPISDSPARLSNLAGLIAVLAIAGAALLNTLWAYLPLYRTPVAIPRWRGWVHPAEVPFVRLTHVLQQLPSGEKLAGWPNLALQCLLADRPFPTTQVNYMGDLGPDIDRFLDEIRDRGVQWVVVNRELYPYGRRDPVGYFGSADRFAELLVQRGYKLERRIEYFELYRRLEPASRMP